jgi:cytidylate kinase
MGIITISRGTFSGGKAVAEGLAARLNYPCISLEILDAADATGGAGEDPKRLLTRLNRGRSELIRHAREGNLVYHGFAGHLLLPGVSHVLRVRIIADMEYRIRAAVRELGLTREEAAPLIRAQDEQSMKRALSLYGVRWNDPSLYDVVLNLDHIGTESAVHILLGIAGLDEFRPTDESRCAFENLALGSRVWAVLATDHRTRRADIRVMSVDGVVTITGNVGSEKVLAALPHVAGEIEGVKEVRCEAAIGAHWMW